MIRTFLDLVYPPKCVVCGEKIVSRDTARLHLCEKCFQSISFIQPPFCKKCGRHIPPAVYNLLDGVCIECKNKSCYFDNIRAVCAYEGVIKECLHKFKYSKKLFLLDLLGKLSAGFIKQHLAMGKFDLIVPVPIHRKRLRERGFNQAELLSAYIAKQFNIPLLKNNLLRTKYLAPQTALNKSQRTKNIKDNFMVKEPYLFEKKSVLLLDDVFTTGSTVNECAKTIAKCGSGEITVITLARGA